MEEYADLQEALFDPGLEKLLQVGREEWNERETLDAARASIMKPDLNSYHHFMV